MPVYSRCLIIKSLLMGLVWQTHWVPTLAHGKIICVSDPSGTTGGYLTAGEVKKKAIETYSESDVRHFLEGDPRFYKYQSTVFTDLDQRNSIKDDDIIMENQLASTKYQFHKTYPYSMSETDFDKLSQTMKYLEDFQKRIQKEIKHAGIWEMQGPASYDKEIEKLEIGQNAHHWFWDSQLNELSGILHQIPLFRDNDQKIITEGNELSFNLQNLLFQQVGYMYKKKMISKEAFKNFCQSKKTLDIAALNMIVTTSSRQALLYLSPATVLNEWTSEHFRNIYEVLDAKDKRYFSYSSLKAFYYTFKSFGNNHPESLCEEDKLFNTLENLISPPSRKSDSKMKLKKSEYEDPNYVAVEEFIKKSISMFQDNEYYPFQNLDNHFKTLDKERSFSFLYFIQNNYGLGIFQLEKGKKFEEKMNLMLSSLQVSKELTNIYRVMKEGRINWGNIPETKINKEGEEILMIYKLLKDLVSKHQYLFQDSKMSNYCRTFELKILAEAIDKGITLIIDQHQYLHG